MSKPFHIYQVFNPMLNENSVYLTQAHEFYYALKNKLKENPEGCFYWGKISVTDDEEDAKQFQSFIDANAEYGFQTHLYLTDYHHFWVAKVERVQTHTPKESLTLPFYDDKQVSVWFKITDMDLLSADFQESSHYIAQLSLNHIYSEAKIESLTPYVGGLKYPLIVHDKTEERYFSLAEARVTKENLLVDHPGSHQQMQKQVTTFVLPPHVFKQLSHDSKQGILHSELKLNQITTSPEARNEIYQTYCKVLEDTLDQVIGEILKNHYASTLWVKNDGSDFYEPSSPDTVALGDFNGRLKAQSFLNLVSKVKEFGNITLEQIEKDFPELVGFFINEFTPFIERYEVLGKYACLEKGQSPVITPAELFALRNFVLGVGCQGLVNLLFDLKIQWQGRNRLPAA